MPFLVRHAQASLRQADTHLAALEERRMALVSKQVGALKGGDIGAQMPHGRGPRGLGLAT